MVPARRVFLTLRADGKVLDASPRRMGWLRPSSSNEPFDELTARFGQDGYLYLKGFLDRDLVLD
ncbi:MAG: hypothetical protein ABIY37_09770 [Devosia sp.]